ncbi:hypothetical protein TNCV_2988151 [Trichonephila clavipes]|nr:hypothetical protein TNCV_2988151 [Trichonephila clavipes]
MSISVSMTLGTELHEPMPQSGGAAVAEWSRYLIVAGLVTSSRLVGLKTRRVGQRCTLNLSRAHSPPVRPVTDLLILNPSKSSDEDDI